MSLLPDRAPPEIEPGVTVASLATVEDCDRALDGLTMAITQIERQLKSAPRNSPNQPPGWRANAEAALRIKRFLMPRVQERRAEVKRQVRQEQIQAARADASPHPAGRKRRILIGIAWEHEPEAMKRVEAIARELHPDLFHDGEAA